MRPRGQMPAEGAWPVEGGHPGMCEHLGLWYSTGAHTTPKLAVDGMQTGGATTIGPKCVSVEVLRSRPVPGSLILKDTEKLVFTIQAFLINQEGFH